LPAQKAIEVIAGEFIEDELVAERARKRRQVAVFATRRAKDEYLLQGRLVRASSRVCDS
jgi:hypothetical protein